MEFPHLDALLKDIADTMFPGVDCCVCLRHEPVYRGMYGYADAGARRPVSADTVYNLYSITKMVTCAAALQLHERGDFLMFQPVSDFIPEFREMTVLRSGENGKIETVPAQHPILIQDLFRMTGGLSYDLSSPSILRMQRETGGRCPTLETVKAIAGEPLVYEPGTRWNYSLCHDVLGALIEVISGVSFGEYLQKNIFDPIGMKETTFHPDEEKKSRLAAQYILDPATGECVPKQGNDFVFGTEYESGGAGLISTVDDFMLFAETLCRFGTAANGEKILSGNSVRLMRMNHLTPEQMKGYNWVHLGGYGYGLGVRTLLDPAVQSTLCLDGEFGWTGAAGAFALIDPENELSVYYSQQVLGYQPTFVHQRIRNALYADLT